MSVSRHCGRFLVGASRLLDVLDRFAIDGMVTVLATTIENLSFVLRPVQNGLVRRYVWIMLIGLLLIGLAAPFWP